jgi:flavodoxin
MSQKQLLIIYAGHTEDGSTATIAGWIADGASKYVRAIIKKASDVTIDDVANADGYVLGSGVYNGNPEPDMIEFSESVLNAGKNPNHLDMSNRFVGAFLHKRWIYNRCAACPERPCENIYDIRGLLHRGW